MTELEPPTEERDAQPASAAGGSALSSSARHLGLLQTTGVGIGAIVGGGILVLAGTAFAATGPSAIIAFAVNGLVAFLTAMSFAEISTRFPESGGPYTFAKKVLNVRAAFSVGWIVWFAYIVAAVLYALGFASFAKLALAATWVGVFGAPARWLEHQGVGLVLATLPSVIYCASLVRRSSGGGQGATVGKVLVFAIIIVAGAVAFWQQPWTTSREALSPFFSNGAAGLLSAMGFTFIALQGFDLISAVGGEVKDPGRNIPRAMFASLGCALVVYLPLLFFVSTVGLGDVGSIAELAAREGDTLLASAVGQFMGGVGYWLVIVAALLSTLSALQANLYAASRVALAMAKDHTLPAVLGQRHPTRGTPVTAIYATGLTLVAILFMGFELAAAGAAASLIFLVCFLLTHVITALARYRGGASSGYSTPFFPLVPVLGGLSCAALAIFQAVTVPEAGRVVLIWLGLGGILYLAVFRTAAETVDASAEVLDPGLAQLRGRSPLVLVPLANPQHARSLSQVANALAPSDFARVLFLNVLGVGDTKQGIAAADLADTHAVLTAALGASFARRHPPEALITTAASPMAEIERVAEEHKCQSLLLGIASVPSAEQARVLERLINSVDCDVAVMRASADFDLTKATRVLVPVGGQAQEQGLRARFLASLCRLGRLQLTFVRVLPDDATDAQVAVAEQAVRKMSDIRLPADVSVQIRSASDPVKELVELASNYDSVILGLGSNAWGKREVGDFALRVLGGVSCSVILLSTAPSSYAEMYRPLRNVVNAWPGRKSS